MESGKAQIIVTTHSPYILDLLQLEHIILVERDEMGQPVFTKPTEQKALEFWSPGFSSVQKIISHCKPVWCVGGILRLLVLSNN